MGSIGLIFNFQFKNEIEIEEIVNLNFKAKKSMWGRPCIFRPFNFQLHFLIENLFLPQFSIQFNILFSG